MVTFFSKCKHLALNCLCTFYFSMVRHLCWCLECSSIILYFIWFPRFPFNISRTSSFIFIVPMWESRLSYLKSSEGSHDQIIEWTLTFLQVIWHQSSFQNYMQVITVSHRLLSRGPANLIILDKEKIIWNEPWN